MQAQKELKNKIQVTASNMHFMFLTGINYQLNHFVSQGKREEGGIYGY